LSATSANPGLVPDNNISFGGSGSSRSVMATPAIGQIGVAPITVTASDGTNTASSTFGLMVLPASSVIFYDPFSYADGSVVVNSGALWANHTGTYGQCQVVNGQLQVTGTQTEDVAGTLAGAPYNKNLGVVLYASFKAKFLSLPKTTPEYFADFIAGSAQRARIFAGAPTNASPGTFRLYVANGSVTNTILADELATNTTYTLVSRYDLDTATTTLWVNPASESSTSATATDPQAAAAVSAFSFRQDSGLGATIIVDDLKVGLSFAAVTSTNVATTPILLKIQAIGGNVVLSWADPAFGLQSASSILGPFATISGATSPYTNASSGTKYFRLKSN
jgi:hypothetical protein